MLVKAEEQRRVFQEALCKTKKHRIIEGEIKDNYKLEDLTVPRKTSKAEKFLTMFNSSVERKRIII